MVKGERYKRIAWNWQELGDQSMKIGRSFLLLSFVFSCFKVKFGHVSPMSKCKGEIVCVKQENPKICHFICNEYAGFPYKALQDRRL